MIRTARFSRVVAYYNKNITADFNQLLQSKIHVYMIFDQKLILKSPKYVKIVKASVTATALPTNLRLVHGRQTIKYMVNSTISRETYFNKI